VSIPQFWHFPIILNSKNPQKILKKSSFMAKEILLSVQLTEIPANIQDGGLIKKALKSGAFFIFKIRGLFC